VQFAGDEVILADELRVVDDVELFAGRQLLATDAADEALEMVDGLTSPTDEIVGQDALTTAAALGAETSAVIQHNTVIASHYIPVVLRCGSAI